MVAHFRTSGRLFDGSAKRAVVGVSRAWMQGVAKRTRDTVRELSPVATGGFRRSVVYRTWERGGTVYGSVHSTMPDAAVETIEGGRRAGAAPPPESAIARYLIARGIDMRFLKAVIWHIHYYGTKGHFMFERGEKRMRGLLNSQTNHLEIQIARELSR